MLYNYNVIYLSSPKDKLSLTQIIMQEINNEFYQAFCDKFYDVENKCTNDLIVKAILYSNNKGIEITLRNGNKFLLNATRINQN